MRRRRTMVTAAAILLISAGAGVAPATADTTTAATTQVSAEFSNASITALTGANIPVTLTAGPDELSGATISLDLRHVVLKDAELVSEWLSGTSGQADWGGDRHVDTYTVPTTAAGARTSMTLAPTRAQLSLGDLSRSQGFVPFSVTAHFADGSEQTERGVVPWNLSDAVGLTRIVVPITAPATDEDVYSEKELTQWTSPQGVLSRLASAVASVPVVIAIDPKIVASITTLDASSQPAQWLAAMTGTHSTVLLQYGNADVATLAAAGLTSLPHQDSSVSGWAGASIAWANGTTLTRQAATLYAQAGYSAIAVPSARIQNHSWTQGYTIGGASVAVTDSVLTSAVEAAVTGGGGGIGTALATRALESSPSVDRLVVLPATWYTPDTHLSEVLSAFTQTTWAQISTATTRETTSTDTTEATIVGPPEATVDAEMLTGLTVATQSATTVATLVQGDNRTILTDSLQRILLSLSSRAWIGSSTWAPSVSSATDRANAVTNAVHLAPQASVRLISNESVLPVPVVNDLPYSIQVNVLVRASSGQLVVTKGDAVTIDPKTTAQVLVPVKAVANGNVTLRMQLTDASGATIGNHVDRNMTVSAEWESVFAFSLVGAVALLFGIGLVRGIRRHRRGLAQANDAAEPDTNAHTGKAP